MANVRSCCILLCVISVNCIFDRFYILKGDGLIKYIDASSIVDMHLYHRSKKLKIIPKILYINGSILNEEIQTNEIKKASGLDISKNNIKDPKFLRINSQNNLQSNNIMDNNNNNDKININGKLQILLPI